MQLQIHLKRLQIGRALRDQILEQFETAFERLARHIRSITVRLIDMNGPHGGLDKRCQVAVHLHRGGTIRGGRTDRDLVAAVNLATDRVTHAVSRELKKRRSRADRIKAWPMNEDNGDWMLPSQA